MFESIPLIIPSRVFIPLIPLKTLTPTPQNSYPWSMVRVFRGKGKGSPGMTPGLSLTILNNNNYLPHTPSMKPHTLVWFHTVPFLCPATHTENETTPMLVWLKRTMRLFLSFLRAVAICYDHNHPPSKTSICTCF